MTANLAHFAIPGDINALTGGYGYDRRLRAELEALGFAINHLRLSGTYPMPDTAAIADTEAQFAALPDGAIVLVDGLAYGAMDAIAERHGERLRLVALCHHPLALETGLAQDDADRLQHSEQRALNVATAILATSTMTATILTRHFSVDRSKIVVAPPGTDKRPFAACTATPPLLLTVATLIPRKAHDVLIAALARIAHLPWAARFAGNLDSNPGWTAHLQQLTAAHGLEQRIHFSGTRADLSDEYAQASLFVLPSLFEGYGMVFAEALACGLPIVAARAGAVPEVVPKTAGMLVPPGDVDALAAVLGTLLRQPAARARLQRGARRAANRLPAWADTARIVADLITTVRKR